MLNRIILFFFIATNLIFSQNKAEQFSIEIKTKYSYQYYLHKPEGNNLKPLLIFLHGSGERGTNIEMVKVHGPLKYNATSTLDAYILAPQCPENEYWESESLYALIQNVIKSNKNIDTSRIYLTGLSMGAWGAWNLAFAHPDMFAALVPIAGFVDRVPMIENCKIALIPTRIFHGLLDDVVDVNYSIEIYKKLQKCNKDIKLTVFDDANHDSWTRVYDNHVIYDWMFQQKKPKN